MNPKVDIAVVMPSYNPGSQIIWTLDSLRVQTVPFKLFVVDDGSTEKPDYPALLAGFDNELIELPNNVGPNTVRNSAVDRALAQGFAYIAQMDCGDWAYPNRLEEQRRFLEEHNDVALIGAAVEILNDDKSFAYTFEPPESPEAIRQALFYGTTFKHPAIMARASLLQQIGRYSDEFFAAEDYDLVRRAAAVADIANMPAILLKTVEYDNGVTATRRFAQLVSRMRIQWRYRELTSLHFWLGAGKTLLSMLTPVTLLRYVRPMLHPRKRAVAPRGRPESVR